MNTMKKTALASGIALALGSTSVLATQLSGAATGLTGFIASNGSYTFTNDTDAVTGGVQGYGNFTMIDASGGLVGGTNDVAITWDGSVFNASSDYTGPGSVANVTMSSPTAFNGGLWTAHDIQAFAPGTYSFDTSLGAGNPESGTLNVTVPANHIGMHMLFDWNGNNNIDVFIVLAKNSIYAAGVIRTAATGTSCSNATIVNCLENRNFVTGYKPVANQVWSLATVDGNGDSIMGIPMAAGGPFAGFNAGFNLTFNADTTAPVITRTGAASVSVGTNDPAYSDAGATATDNKDASITVTPSVSPTFNQQVPGTYTFTYNASDSASNASGVTVGGVTRTVSNNAATPVTRTVTVSDTTPPVITNATASESIPACATYGTTEAMIGVSASDNIDGTITNNVVVGGLPADTCVTGTYPLTYNVSDAATNAATPASRTLSIVNGNPPVITVTATPASEDVDEDTTYTLAMALNGVSASDVEDGPITLTSGSVSGWNFDTSTPGSFTIIYNVQDSSGNNATPKTRTVTVHDKTGPTLTLNTGDDNVGTSDAAWVDAGATVTDNYDATRTITGTGTVNQALPGTYNIIYSTTDAAGNAASNNGLIRPVTVFDNTAPVITLNGSASVSIAGGSTYTDAGATATDNVDNSVTVNCDSSAVNVNTVGSYTVTCTASDNAGNPATPVNRTVNVTSGQPPVITLNGSANVSLNVGDTYTEAGATATDAEDGTLNPASIVIAGTVDTTTEGTYTITYNVTDSLNNQATEVTRTVTVYAASIVVAPTPPVLTASQGGNDSRVIITGAGNVTVSLDQSASTYDWSASDVAASITDAATFTFDPSSLTAGLYEISVTVNAGTNDESTASLLLRVLTSAPALTTADTDGDGVDDVTEGVADSDGDGIANYLDDSTLTATQLSAGSNGSITTSAGTLRLGTTAFGAGAVSGLISSSDVNSFGGQGASSVTNGTDAGAITPCVGGCFDFEVTGLTQGQTIQVVLPLSAGIPEIAAYRIYTPADGWHDFVVSGEDAIASSGLVNGDCPSASTSGRWVDGLFPGDRCVRLTIQDGGPNDTDGVANGVVTDPSGVAEVPTTVVINKADGCSMTVAENQASDHADWWLVTAFLSMLGWFGFKRRKA